MPERDKYPSKYFSGNPFEGKDAFDVYKQLRWGEEWNEAFEINAPEDMAVLGMLCRIKIMKGAKFLPGRSTHQRSTLRDWKWKKKEAPYLTVGAKTNALYVVPQGRDGGPINVPSDGYVLVGHVSRTEYYSEKGPDGEALYYHDHEQPFPTLYYHPQTGCMYFKPAKVKGKGARTRSYAVGPEGIIG